MSYHNHLHRRQQGYTEHQDVRALQLSDNIPLLYYHQTSQHPLPSHNIYPDNNIPPRPTNNVTYTQIITSLRVLKQYNIYPDNNIPVSYKQNNIYPDNNIPPRPSNNVGNVTNHVIEKPQK